MIWVSEFPDPLGLLRLDVPPLAVELVVEGLARHDHGLQLLAVIVQDVLLVGELLTRLFLLSGQNSVDKKVFS